MLYVCASTSINLATHQLKGESWLRKTNKKVENELFMLHIMHQMLETHKAVLSSDHIHSSVLL